METAAIVLTVLGGLVAGFIDSIAGGGGLLTLPILAMLVGPGADAVGTNKIVGLCGAFVAFLVYLRAGHFLWRPGVVFGVWIAVGSLCGSIAGGHIPASWFPWLLALTAPLILFIALRRDLWVRSQHQTRPLGELLVLSFRDPSFVFGGILCGFYDGAWGPGGGSFMFLTLFFLGRLSLLQALAAAKLVNTVSAGTALVSFAAQGKVHWLPGAVLASGMATGALVGSQFATRKAAAIVRPVLVVVVLLLLAKTLTEYAR